MVHGLPYACFHYFFMLKVYMSLATFIETYDFSEKKTMNIFTIINNIIRTEFLYDIVKII